MLPHTTLMATINSKAIVDKIVAGDGYYPGDEHIRVVRIVQYNNNFDGAVCYGLEYEGELGKYAETEWVRNPKVYWEAGN